MFRWIDIVLFGTATLLFIPAFLFNMTGEYGQRPAPHVDLTALWDREWCSYQPFPSHPSQLPGVLSTYRHSVSETTEANTYWGGIS